MLAPVLRYGILKERMAALITDGLRAGLLETKGYDTQILEFIDMEHTPKNLLIRAVKTEKSSRRRGFVKLWRLCMFLLCLRSCLIPGMRCPRRREYRLT